MNAFSNLGIDFSSVVLYLVNIGLLLVVLTRFLYKPLLKYIDERRETVRKNISEAEEMKKSFEAELEKQEAKTKELVAQLQEEIRSSRQEAEERAKNLLAEAQKQKEQIIGEAQAKVDQMKSSIRHDIEAETLAAIEKTVLVILKNKVPENVVRESVKSSWTEVSKVASKQ